MDVTSMLNSNSAAVEQQKRGADSSSNSSAPARNRTPWDADGYSLPTNTARSQQQISCGTRCDEPHIGTPPYSPRHRFSDSRSSLSSFTSSLQSVTTHSRFSSTSTLNSNSHLQHNSLSTSLLSPELKGMPLILDSSRGAGLHKDSSLSPTVSPLNNLALVADGQLSEQQIETSTMKAPIFSVDSARNDRKGPFPDDCSQKMSPSRPSSPSDAIMIKRTVVPILRVDTGSIDEHQQPNYLSAPIDRFQPSLLSKQHKRTHSAPSLRAPVLISVNPSFFNPCSPASTTLNPTYIPARTMNDTTMVSLSTHGPRAEPTPPSSQHPDSSSPTSPPTYTSPDTPPTLVPESETQTIVCMYIPNCDTGSQMRKAISHIFGRNKMCTRLIPQHVWVHYCRKHYQRSRYRNPKEYAKLQCDLVQEQIRRVHYWSEENARRGVPGVVRDWSLAIRKREQKRIDDMENKKRKRSSQNIDSEEDVEDVDAQGLSSVPATAVPLWLRDMCGKNRYSTQEICEIFNRLHTEILEDKVGGSFPDLEILPSIIVDQDEPKSPKGYCKRTSSSSLHRRSQSLGVSTSTVYGSPDGRSSHPSALGVNEASTLDPPSPKKRRQDTHTREDLGERQGAQPSGRRISHLAHRPMFPDIQENQEWREVADSYQVPLPGPTTQASCGLSMAAQIDHHECQKRPHHGRSQSDMGALIRQTPMNGSSSTGYNLDAHGRVASSSSHRMDHPISTYSHYQFPTSHQYPSSNISQFYQEHPMNTPTHGHMRHQSTPLIQGPYHTALSYQQFTHDYRSAANRNTPASHIPHVAETEQARALYSARR